MFDTPILILGFNRPNLFADLLNTLRDLSPTNVYVAIDGPRDGNEEDVLNVEKTYSSIHLIDWQCRLKVLKRESNLGCGLAVSSAISWVFESESKIIVLEDDIRPNKSFFEFCSQALIRFANDERIMTISGHSVIEIDESKDRFRLSKYPDIWGWATWKRSWNLYQFSIADLPKISFRQLLAIYNGNFLLAMNSAFNFRKMRLHIIDTWDYQLLYCSFLHNKLHLIPNYNLASNVGFGGQATHTRFLPKPSPAVKEMFDFNFQNDPLCLGRHERRYRVHEGWQLRISVRSHLFNILSSKFKLKNIKLRNLIT